MPAYVLMGFDRDRELSLEGALKYFLLSMVASLLFLYGLSFVIGMSGSTLIAETQAWLPGNAGLIAALFLCAGLLAKLSAAPFQCWSPDAYAGAPVRVGRVRLLRPEDRRRRRVRARRPVRGAAACRDVGRPRWSSRRSCRCSCRQPRGLPADRHAAGSWRTPASRTRATCSWASPPRREDAGRRRGPARTRSRFGAAVFYALAYAVPSMAIMFVVDRGGRHPRRLQRPGEAPAVGGVGRWCSCSSRSSACRRSPASPASSTSSAPPSRPADLARALRAHHERRVGGLLLPDRARDVLRRACRGRRREPRVAGRGVRARRVCARDRGDRRRGVAAAGSRSGSRWGKASEGAWDGPVEQRANARFSMHRVHHCRVSRLAPPHGRLCLVGLAEAGGKPRAGCPPGRSACAELGRL